MKVLGVIPARMESSRFFGKPLENILGIPMIAHCYERALMSDCDELVISTPNTVIRDWCFERNIPAIITSNLHERASERAEETLRMLEVTIRVKHIHIRFSFKATNHKFAPSRDKFCDQKIG